MKLLITGTTHLRLGDAKYAPPARMHTHRVEHKQKRQEHVIQGIKGTQKCMWWTKSVYIRAEQTWIWPLGLEFDIWTFNEITANGCWLHTALTFLILLEMYSETLSGKSKREHPYQMLFAESFISWCSPKAISQLFAYFCFRYLNTFFIHPTIIQIKRSKASNLLVRLLQIL